MRPRPILVTATPWHVSYETCASLFDGAKLHVFRDLPNSPNEWGGTGRIVHHPEYYGLRFPTVEAAQDFALAKGFLMPFRRARRNP